MKTLFKTRAFEPKPVPSLAQEVLPGRHRARAAWPSCCRRRTAGRWSAAGSRGPSVCRRQTPDEGSPPWSWPSFGSLWGRLRGLLEGSSTATELRTAGTRTRAGESRHRPKKLKPWRSSSIFLSEKYCCVVQLETKVGLPCLLNHQEPDGTFSGTEWSLLANNKLWLD